jgi:hypothetical protein
MVGPAYTDPHGFRAGRPIRMPQPSFLDAIIGALLVALAVDE